ncbi:MAG TPA: DUF3857 domain-containing protein [Candidatus Angelobacter sp.]|nr:DUF3857 domain-containing protein [Candidatus Angelobacter sp.]
MTLCHFLSPVRKTLYFFAILALAIPAWASDPLDGPAFSATPEQLRQAAAAIKAEKHTEATILLSEKRFSFDQAGKETHIQHMIYRIEDEEGVQGWAEISGRWSPWYQAKPEIKARVITADGAEHWLDGKTMTDVPVHENSSETYSDDRSLGGPLPAIAVGAIVEEEVTTRDTGLFFAGGITHQDSLAWNVPVAHTRVVLSHAETLPLRYVLHMLPDASVTKSHENGIETINIENGSIAAYPESTHNVPADVLLYPEVEFATGTSWQQVALEYGHLTSDKLRVADVQPMLAKLGLQDAPRGDVIRKLVMALHKDVRYTGIEFGESSIVPVFPAETLKRKYGDCKDKAALLATMLRAAGIPASLALLSTGPGQDVNPELPGMGSFDHAIVYVPPSASDSEMWIDATAEYDRIGSLPTMDYGRAALVVDPGTTSLKKIPALTADQNVHIETREFVLAEYGPATITEIDEATGPEEAEYRSYYAGDSKKIRENAEAYVKNAYLAEKLGSMDKTDPGDLNRKFQLTLTATGRRGFTSLDNAVAAIRIEGLFYNLPDYFTAAEESGDKDDKTDAKPPRTADWEIKPYITEWRYKIRPPLGFHVRALPPDRDEILGMARFTQKYSVTSSGDVEAILRFDSGKARLTVQEATALRDAILQIKKKNEVILVNFDQTGYSLLAAGKVKEALESFRQLAAQHPKEALHKVQISRVLLDAGLGERARIVAREAVALEPTSVQALTNLAWILQHDLIGRRFQKGFDHEGAVAAYRKAKQLDPKDKDLRANLAILLETDEDGERYSSKAHLKEAVAEFRELKKLDEDYARTYDDNVLWDLWYERDFAGVKDYGATLSGSDLRKSFLLAAIAASEGTEAALKKSLEITSTHEGRSTLLNSAAAYLLRIRKYEQAEVLFEASLEGSSSGGQVANLIALLKKTKPHEEINLDPADPRSVVQNLLLQFLDGKLDYDQVRGLMSKSVLDTQDSKTDREEFQAERRSTRKQLQGSGLPVDVIADIAISSIRYSVEGDDSLGYRLLMEAPGAATEEGYVVREDGQYKIAELLSSPSKTPENLGWEVLARLGRKDLPGARKWLDWAREKVHVNTGDDPLSGQMFPWFWTKGQEGDEAAIRRAALVLLPSKALKGQLLADLIQYRDQTKDDTERTRLNLVLAYAYAAQEQWPELQKTSGELLKSSPDSLVAFHFATSAYAGLKKLDDWGTLIQAVSQKHPDELEYTRSAATLALYNNDFAKARELMKGLMDRGRATSQDLNNYAWYALSLGKPPDQDAIDAAQRASQMSKNDSFGILHTLACLYAEAGKTTQAHELLLKAIEAAHEDEPNSEIWFGFGKIAEQYGELDAARALYGRMEKPKTIYPGSSYVLAQQRLAALQNYGVSANRNAGQ